MNFTVLMSVYHGDCALNFHDAFSSILTQTLVPDEVVIVVDGPISKDLRQEVVWATRQYGPRVYVANLETNLGLGRALAYGLNIVTNDVVARMDADDIACPTRFAKQIAAMESNKTLAIVGGQVIEFSSDSQQETLRMVPETLSEIRQFARKRSPFNHPAVMLRKSLILSAGGYQHFPNFEDYHLWIRCLCAELQVRNIPDVVVRMRTDQLHHRRGGMKYWLQAYAFRRFAWRLGINSRREVFMCLCSTGVACILPSCIRRILYRYLLRERLNE